MSFRIKLFIVLALLGVGAAYFMGGKSTAPRQQAASTPVETGVQGVLYGTIKADRVSLRRQPGGSGFAYLNQGQRVTVLSDSRAQAWVEVRAGALSGWVSLSDIAFDGE